MQLGLQSTWKGTPDEIQLAQERSNLLITLFLGQNPCDCNEPCPEQQGVDCGCDGDCEMCCLRFNNGVLQALQCGVWVDVPGQMPGAGAQPGVGSPQPQAGGGLQVYDGCFNGANSWVLPTLVSAGDTIEIQSTSGAWNDPDSDGLLWRTPNGLQFALGAAIPGTDEFVGTDPLPSAPHMSLIANIAGTFYSLVVGPFTVPGGVSNSQVIIQANDSALSDDQGNVCFTVQVTNNQQATWTHEFDFTVSTYGWAAAVYSGIPAGTWVSGTGWNTGDINDSGTDERVVNLVISAAARTITRLEMIFDLTPGSYSSGGDTAIQVLLDPAHVTPIAVLASGVTSGAGQDLTSPPVSVAATTTYTIFLASSILAHPLGFSGTAVLRSVKITGLGTDPF